MSNQKKLSDINYSVLDLSPIIEGSTPSDSFKNSVDLALHAEKLGYKRFWMAEHHNMPSIASSATSVILSHIAANTSTIRIGSGGIMLPNHAPLVIAEQFGTLESLFPGRIDLGLGRAPGTDQLTARALRRDRKGGQGFPELLDELRSYFNPDSSADDKHVRAFPGEGLDIPIWLLGSSGFSAQLAAQKGLPFAFASHFSPDNTLPALDLYRDQFEPSNDLKEPYSMVGVSVIAADTDEEAERLATSLQQQFLNLIRNQFSPLQPPVDSMENLWSEFEKAGIQRQLSSTIIGSPATVEKKLKEFANETQADEMIIAAQIYDHRARLRSYEIVSEIVN